MIQAPDSLIAANQIAEVCDLARSTPPGCIVEVGVYKGGSAWHLAKVATAQHRELHLFDTFTGIPHALPCDLHQVGEFRDCDYMQVWDLIPSAIMHIGTFPRTLSPDVRNIAFAHIDCDQYQSVADCITHLWPLMVEGGIMLFDDYGCLDGATRAVKESLKGERMEMTSIGRAYFRKEF